MARSMLLALALLLTCALSSAAPNLIMLSVDDGVTSSALSTAYTDTVVAADARNPNGCRPPITWFSDGRSDCDAVMQAYSLGHELATHTVNHPNDGPDLSYDEWADEVGGQRSWLASCGVPEGEVKGFRAPYYDVSSTLGTVLQDLGLLYDSSLSGKGSPAAPMNEYFPYSCGWECEGWDQLSIWEVPAYALEGSSRKSDPEPVDGMSVLERLQSDFEAKRGTGVPTSIMVHENYLEDSSNREDVVAFLQWSLAQNDTYAITYSQYVAWLQGGQDSIDNVLSSYTCDE